MYDDGVKVTWKQTMSGRYANWSQFKETYCKFMYVQNKVICKMCIIIHPRVEVKIVCFAYTHVCAFVVKLLKWNVLSLNRMELSHMHICNWFFYICNQYPEYFQYVRYKLPFAGDVFMLCGTWWTLEARRRCGTQITYLYS